MEIIKNLEIINAFYGSAGVGKSESGQVIFVQKTIVKRLIFVVAVFLLILIMARNLI